MAKWSVLKHGITIGHDDETADDFIIMMIQVTCLALQTIGGAELYRGAADIR